MKAARSFAADVACPSRHSPVCFSSTHRRKSLNRPRRPRPRHRTRAPPAAAEGRGTAQPSPRPRSRPGRQTHLAAAARRPPRSPDAVARRARRRQRPKPTAPAQLSLAAGLALDQPPRPLRGNDSAGLRAGTDRSSPEIPRPPAALNHPDLCGDERQSARRQLRTRFGRRSPLLPPRPAAATSSGCAPGGLGRGYISRRNTPVCA
jgi:hypothetical protein